MKQSLIVKYVFPFFQWYGLMIFLAIAIDYFPHRYQLASVGCYLGFIGTFVIIISFIYSLRKRKIIKSGSPKQLLALHEYFVWIGSIMILVHARIHFNAVVPWLAILMLLIAVALKYKNHDDLYTYKQQSSKPDTKSDRQADNETGN